MGERKRIELICESCGYKYVIEVFETYEEEVCPICGHTDFLDAFME